MRAASLLSRYHSIAFAFGNLKPFRHRTHFFESTMKPVKPTESPIPLDAKVNKFQQVLRSASPSSNDWEKCWNEGLTPWDLGAPTPVLVHLRKMGSLPKGRALIPGCGTGYDVVAIACAERHVTGIDISESAIAKATEVGL